MNHYIYILRSEANTTKTYKGETNNLARRIVEHNTQTEDKTAYTYDHRPWKIEAFAYADTKETAEVVEKYLKNTSGKECIKRKTGKADGFKEFFSDLPIGTSFGTQHKFEVCDHVTVPVFRMKPKTQSNPASLST